MMKGFKKLNYVESWGAVQDFKILDLTSLKILEYVFCGFSMTAFKWVTSLVAGNSEFCHLYMSYTECSNKNAAFNVIKCINAFSQ
jgi:hypothetical protein